MWLASTSFLYVRLPNDGEMYWIGCRKTVVVVDGGGVGVCVCKCADTLAWCTCGGAPNKFNTLCEREQAYMASTSTVRKCVDVYVRA